MLKKLLLSGATVSCLAPATLAADIDEPATFDWTGPYIGLQAGYGWGENDVQWDLAPPALVNQRGASDPLLLDPLSDGSIAMDGILGGLHTGYNWQMDGLVLGIEGDAELAGMKGDTDIYLAEGDEDPNGRAEQDVDWLASLRLRAGFAADRALLYVTGGLAASGAEQELVLGHGIYKTQNDETLWGWTLGGGMEYALTADLSARLEYRYTDLGDSDVDIDDDAAAQLDGGPGSTVKFDNELHTVRAGLSWHF